MKQMILCVGIMCSAVVLATAQVTPKKKTVKTPQTTYRISTGVKDTKFNRVSANSSGQADRTITLSSTGNYKALADTASAATPYRIFDPTIRMFNVRTSIAADVPIEGSGIIGMPKLSYGIANGQILLRSTGTPTIGTGTGSGSVGTGTNPGPVGTGGNVIGVNGKSPYAGPGIYSLPITDERRGAVPVSAAAAESGRKKKD